MSSELRSVCYYISRDGTILVLLQMRVWYLAKLIIHSTQEDTTRAAYSGNNRASWCNAPYTELCNNEIMQ